MTNLHGEATGLRREPAAAGAAPGDRPESTPAAPADGPILPGSATDSPTEVARHGIPFTVTVAAGFVAVGTCMIVLGTIAEAVRTQEVIALDTVASPLLHSFASPQLDAVMQTATFVGSNTAVIPAMVGVSVLLLRRDRRRDAFFVVVAVVGSILLNSAMKLFFQRARPQLPWATVLPDYSFPSGHTMTSLVFLLALAIVAWQARGRTAGLVAMAAAVVATGLIGLSRVYLGYHYLTDVVGGLLSGLLWLLVVVGAFRVGRRYFGDGSSRANRSPA